jgi:hypothetical protein
MKASMPPVASPSFQPFLSSNGDSTERVALCCEQIQAIAERLIDTKAYAGWSEDDVLRVMKREGSALEVFHHHLQGLLSHTQEQA